MKLWCKLVLYALSTLTCVFCCVGYASVSDSMHIDGTAKMDPALPDLYISNVTPLQSSGVAVRDTVGTVFIARVTREGTARFTVTIKNVSNLDYVYERVIDGIELGVEGVYAGTEITYALSGLAVNDPVAPGGGTITFDLFIEVPEGVTAEYFILKFRFILKDDVPSFPTDMPDAEVTVAERLYEILNDLYTTENITNSCDYLLNETITESWDGGIYPYVGSMDESEKHKWQIRELFGDCWDPSECSFILKREELTGDDYHEVALYSTSDPLDHLSQWPYYVVCVYVTVYTPIVDTDGNITGYRLLCDSLRGYTYEVRYTYEIQSGVANHVPSFSTDHWKDDVGYMNYDMNPAIVVRVPEDALGSDGATPFRYYFPSYNLVYQYSEWGWGDTHPYGNDLKTLLMGQGG